MNRIHVGIVKGVKSKLTTAAILIHRRLACCPGGDVPVVAQGTPGQAS
jgi:hypothetical protein